MDVGRMGFSPAETRGSSFPVFTTILEDIQNRRVRSCVMGLGYVGLPLSLEFVRAGYQVVGLDADEARVRQLREGHSYITDVADGHLRGGPGPRGPPLTPPPPLP